MKTRINVEFAGFDSRHLLGEPLRTRWHVRTGAHVEPEAAVEVTMMGTVKAVAVKAAAVETIAIEPTAEAAVKLHSLHATP